MRKVYGQSRIDTCPFCTKTALSKNIQGIPVCRDHKDKKLDALRSICGEWLDRKYGPYFQCMQCGKISFRKGLDMNGL